MMETVHINMKNINWKIEENLHNDITMITRVLDSSDLTDPRVRMALYDGIRKGSVFQSIFGAAFLDSLISDTMYDTPDAVDMIKRDLTALERIVAYMKSDDRIPVVERMKKYQFRCGWISQFAVEYLDGYCLGASTPNGYLAELSDIDNVRRLVRLGHSGSSFQYDDIYSLMQKPENQGMFRSWIGAFFQEAVRVHTTDFQKKKRLKKWIMILGLTCGVILTGLIFSCVLAAVL